MEFLRKWVQIVVALVTNGSWSFPFTRTLYQGPLKVICAPGLNCYSCPAATSYCSMGAIQQLLGTIRFALENGQYYFSLSVVGTIGILGALFGRMICGWACPFGFIQELLYKLPTRKFGVPRVLRYGKYGFLALFVVLLPLVMVDEFGTGNPWFCKFVCPAGTLEAGLPMLWLQPNLRNTIGLLFYNKLAILVAFVIWSIVASRPFCRTTCPLGAFYALFAKVQILRLRLDVGRCTNCKACHHVCPTGVRFNENPDDPECISCLACMNKACQFNAISLEIAGLPLGHGEKRRTAPTTPH
ncbi:MAG: 4Fe-4S binding protein [Thermodesulfobacteriota bacterium]